MLPGGGPVVAFLVEEYWPWVGGICKCLGENARGFPRGQSPGMAADKCIAAVEKHNEYQNKIEF